jgi:hypothetical protein
MDIDVTVSRDELVGLLEEFAPIRIHFTETDEDRRWLELEQPAVVEFVPGVGVRLVTHGKLRYELAGIKIPATIRKIRLLLIPEVVPAKSSRQSLAFRLELEEGDLVNIPDFIDGALVKRVNSALTPSASGMIWKFGEMLDKSLQLPERLEPLENLRVSVTGGAVAVDHSTICFSIRLSLNVIRSAARPSDAA